jgi:hypothetical protein
VLANIVLQLGNRIEFLLSVNVHPQSGLPQSRSALVLFELSISHYYLI